MAAEKRDEFDVLTFFIYVMGLLTAIVGGFALWNKSKVDNTSRQIRAELSKLEEMKKIAIQEEFREWVSRERESALTGNTNASSTDFQALYLERARSNGLDLTNHTLEGSITHPGGTELPYRLVIKDCRVENLLKFLSALEEEWPGARVKQIVKLDWSERNEAWEAVVVVSIFRATQQT